MDLASSSSGAAAILFPALQQVCSLFHPSSFLHGATGDRPPPAPPRIVIHRPSICEGQRYEGGHERKKANQRGEMR